MMAALRALFLCFAVLTLAESKQVRSWPDSSASSSDSDSDSGGEKDYMEQYISETGGGHHGSKAGFDSDASSQGATHLMASTDDKANAQTDSHSVEGAMDRLFDKVEGAGTRDTTGTESSSHVQQKAVDQDSNQMQSSSDSSSDSSSSPGEGAVVDIKLDAELLQAKKAAIARLNLRH